jgi:hypothetical protein
MTMEVSLDQPVVEGKIRGLGKHPQQHPPSMIKLQAASLQAHQKRQQLHRGRVAVIVADYDNCFDFIAPLGTDNQRAWPCLAHWYPDPAEDGIGWTFDGLAEALETSIESITRGRDEVILFVGSARQSAAWDRANANMAGNGSCHEAYEIMAEERGWKFSKALLDDYGKSLQRPTCEHDSDWFLKRTHRCGAAWGAQRQTCGALEVLEEHHEQLKALIITNVVAQLRKTNPGDLIDLYFFDDRVELLEAARKVKTPANISLHTVWFDHYGFFTGDVTEDGFHTGDETIPKPAQPHLIALSPDGCIEELSLRTMSGREEVKACMKNFEEPFAQKFGAQLQQASVACGKQSSQSKDRPPPRSGYMCIRTSFFEVITIGRRICGG